MTLVYILGIVFVAGGIGGLANAMMTDNGFTLWKWETTGQTSYLRPGIIGNVFVSGVAAVVSWGLYGPFAATNIVGDNNSAIPPSLTLSALVGAVLVGIAGARWLTSEVDKTLLRAAGASAANKSAANPELARAFALSNPAQVLTQATQ
jgi:hypothetical protein